MEGQCLKVEGGSANRSESMLDIITYVFIEKKKRNDWNSLLKFSMEENRIKMPNVIEANNLENLRGKSKLKNMKNKNVSKKYSINED